MNEHVDKVSKAKQIIQVIFKPKEDDDITNVDVCTYNVVNGKKVLRKVMSGYGGKNRT